MRKAILLMNMVVLTYNLVGAYATISTDKFWFYVMLSVCNILSLTLIFITTD